MHPASATWTSSNTAKATIGAHTGLALANGVNLDELKHILDNETFVTVTDREATAILYGKHYADTSRQPTAEARAALAMHFSAYQCLEIMSYIHFIYYSNLSGNSADAWVSRLRGREVPNGHPVAEAIAGLIAAPILFPGWLMSTIIRPQAMKSLDAE